jgi:hypothetical protein
MATFTSVTSGNWNDGATWGKTSPGVKGTDWPGNAGDVVNIGTTANQSHVVLYNVSETNELGAVTVGATSGSGASKLEFATGVNTKITFGHVDLLVQATGEVRGQGGAIIPSAVICELVWHTTSDNAKGINISSGGKWNLSGDPAYYGSKYDYILATQVVIPAATNSVTVTITGNYAANFAAGQELLIHKGGAYALYTNDFARLAVVSAANNGANTDISCTVTERPAALTCLVGADVLNLSRNVMLYMLSYNQSLGNFNSTSPVRPRITSGNSYPTTNTNINDASLGAFANALPQGFVATRCVVRNGNNGSYTQYGGVNTGVIFFSNSVGMSTPFGITLVSCLFVCNNTCCSGGVSISSIVSNTIFYGNNIALTGFCAVNNCFIYANATGITSSIFTMNGGGVGYDQNGIAKANGFDFNYTQALSLKLNYVKTPALASITYNQRNSKIYAYGRVGFEHCLQVANAHHLTDVMGDLDKVSSGWTGTPPSGSTNCVKVATTQNTLGAIPYLAIISQGLFRVWQKAGTMVYRVYIQAPTANNSDYAAADLVLYADYLDQASGGHLATANSSGGITKANDWTQSLTVSVTSAADGWVTLYLRLLKYYAVTDVFYVDPGIWAGGNILMGDWSYGELVYPGPAYFGGGGNSALLPLGVMEAVA